MHGSGASSGDQSSSTKNKFARANSGNAFYSNDCSKRVVLFSDDQDCQSPRKVPATQKLFGNLFAGDEKFNDIFASKATSPKNETASAKLDEMNMSESSCSTDASYGLFSNNYRK